MHKRSYRQMKREADERAKKDQDIFKERQLRIARDTIRMSPVMAKIMGGMTVEEAEKIIEESK